MTSNPSIRYAAIIDTALSRSRRRIKEYIDKIYHKGEPPDVHHASSWKALVTVLVNYEIYKFQAVDKGRKLVDIQTRN